MKVLILLVVLSKLFCLIIEANECVLNLKSKELRIKTPVFIQNDELYYPANEIVHFQNGEVFTLACPGSRNRLDLRDQNLQAINVTCVDGKFHWESGIYDFEKIKCRQLQPSAIVDTTYRRCANGEGVVKQIYFKYKHDNVWKMLPLYKTCYNEDKWESLFAVYTIKGRFWQGVCRTSFTDEGTDTPKGKINTLYNQKKQKEIVSKIHTDLTMYWTTNSYLARGHLIACGDFNFCSTQLSTFYYLNAAPEWQKLNCGNWLSIENQIRNLALVRKLPLTVYTGTHDVLQLKDRKGNLHSIYLGEDKKLPVPKYFWKVVYSRTTEEGIVFIGLNNIYADSSSDIDNLCTYMCQKEGYDMPNYHDMTKGLITCCKFSEIYPKIPRMWDVPRISQVLTNVERGRDYHTFIRSQPTC